MICGAKSSKRFDYDHFIEHSFALALCNFRVHNSLFISKVLVSEICLYVSFYCVNNQRSIISIDGGQENFVRLHGVIPGAQSPAQIIYVRQEEGGVT